MSVLAGFVEPGETAEETVRREIMEEAGIAVGDIDFVATQPWPFPSSLMLAYRARAKTVHIELGDGELEDAGWFTREQIARFAERGLKLPRTDSIAHHLIDIWMREDA